MKELTEEEFQRLKKNLSSLTWMNISSDYFLSESFIRKYQDKLFWSLISHYQKLSEEFIIEFQHHIYYPVLLTNSYFMTYHNSSESFQKFILDKLIGQKFYVEELSLTPYMRKQYEKISIFM